MIKKYLEFINESSYNSIGEWVESLIDDEYVRNVVARYTSDVDPFIDLANAINILDRRTQAEIKYQIEDYLDKGIEEKEPSIITSTETTDLLEESVSSSEELNIAGKGIFNSFLKSLTALGQKESKPNYEKCPDNFLVFYYFSDLVSQEVKAIFSRFKSLLRYDNMIDYGKNEVNLYFGVRCDGQFEYGISYDELNPIGRFKLSQSTIKWMLQLESKSAQSLKKELVNLTYVNIINLGKIKNDIKEFNPGFHEKKLYPTINDKIITFGYYGVGTWNSGKMNNEEFINIKNTFNNWILSKRWGAKVLFSVKQESFWLYISVKLK